MRHIACPNADILFGYFGKREREITGYQRSNISPEQKDQKQPAHVEVKDSRDVHGPDKLFTFFFSFLFFFLFLLFLTLRYFYFILLFGGVSGSVSPRTETIPHLYRQSSSNMLCTCPVLILFYFFNF